MNDFRERHFDKLLTAALLIFVLSLFILMWQLGALETLLDKMWGLVMLFAGLLAGLIQGARFATRAADKNGNGSNNGGNNVAGN